MAQKGRLPTYAEAVATANSIDHVSLRSIVQKSARSMVLGSDVEDPAHANGISLTYRVSLTVEVKARSESGKPSGGTKQKLVLDDACGAVAPGQMLAIMGPSGAGKTSLLNCLSLRNKNYTGYVLHNNSPPDLDTVGITTAFVQQEDLFIPTLTPREHLRFHAYLRMDASISKEDKNQAVEKALLDLGLGKCGDTPIGGQGSTIRGISGGEKKRLAFATEALGDAPILFCDEPTSGLDSFMAEAVITRLGLLAAAGRTIIATIHQPSSQVFNLFSHLHLLADGKTVFCGPLDQTRGHFDSIGHPCPHYYNPSDHYIRVMSRDPAAPQESEKRLNAAAKAYRRSYAYRQTKAKLPSTVRGEEAKSGEEPEIDDMPQFQRSGRRMTQLDSERSIGSYWRHSAVMDTLADPKLEAKKTSGKKVYPADWTSQVIEVYKRTLVMYRREPVLTKARLAQTVVVSLLVGLIFFQLGDTQTEVQSKMGALFFVAINQGILGALGVLQVFPNEMPVFLREHDSGAYRVSSFFLGRTLAEIPIQVVFPAIFAIIMYVLVGLPLDAKVFLLFVAFTVLTANAAISMGYMVSAVAKNVDVALALGPMLIMPFIIFGGLLININEIPDYFIWFSSFSFVQYGYKGVSIAVWEEKGDLDCPPFPEPCTFRTGQAVLDYLEFDGGNEELWRNAAYLTALMVGFRILAFFGLLYRSRPTGDRAY